jgi:hypothetical protein
VSGLRWPAAALTFTLVSKRTAAALANLPNDRITVSSGTPAEVLRVTAGKYTLSFSYPKTVTPINPPPAATVIPAAQLPGLLASHSG